MKKESFDLKSMTLEEINTVIAAMGKNHFAPNNCTSGCMLNSHGIMTR